MATGSESDIESDFLVQKQDGLVETSLPTDWDGKFREKAKDLDKILYIHLLYGMLDGFSNSYSITKWVLDISGGDNGNSSPDDMHVFLMSPGGLIFAALETICLVAFSMMANCFKDSDANRFKRYIAAIWPYLRDAFKGLKNAFRGWRNAVLSAGLLSGHNLNALMIPIGVGLGVLSLINRICIRKYVTAPRKKLMKDNKALFEQARAGRCVHVVSSKLKEDERYPNSYLWVQGENALYFVAEDRHLVLIPREEHHALFKTLESHVQNNLAVIIHRENDTLTALSLDDVRKNIGQQSPHLGRRALFGAAYGGFIDGLYLYMGVLFVASLAPPLFIAMLAFSTLFVALCILTRIYEERDYQQRLKASQAKIELDLCGKEAQFLFAKWHQLSVRSPIDEQDVRNRFARERQTLEACGRQYRESMDEYERQIARINEEEKKQLEALETRQTDIMRELALKQNDFQEKGKKLQSLVTWSYKTAALVGLKNGLAAYSAIATGMFAVAMVLVVCSAPFPPALLIACVIAGAACLIGFLSHALITHHKYRQRQAGQEFGGSVFRLYSLVKDNQKAINAISPVEIEQSICQDMVIDPSPQFFFEEWFEVVRSFFSGFSKAQKMVDYTFNPLQEIGSDGHCHDSKIMIGITAIGAAIYATGLAIRAYARNLSRDPVHEDLKSSAIALARMKRTPSCDSVSMTPEVESKDSPHDLFRLPPPSPSSSVNSWRSTTPSRPVARHKFFDRENKVRSHGNLSGLDQSINVSTEVIPPLLVSGSRSDSCEPSLVI